MIILGGGAAGLTAASGCAQLGMKVLLVEKELMGGDCLHYGCVPSKTLLRSAGVYHQARQMSRYGLPDVSLPGIDLNRVMNRVQEVIGTISHHDSAERFEGLGVQVLFGSPRFLSPREILVGDGTFSASRIVIATGSSPSLPPIPGLESDGFITNKEIFRLEELPESLITIGGGPIGTELSQALARLGSRVTLLNDADQILPREDRDMAAVVEQQLREDGAEVLNGVRITGVRRAGRSVTVRYTRDETDSEVVGTHLLVAAGRRGNTEDLNLEGIGVDRNGSFIGVNNRLQTSLRHIYAIGDVNGQYMFTHVAGTEGSFVVRHAALGLPGSFSYRNVPWVTYTEPELASVGFNEKRAKETGTSYETVEAPLEDNDRAQAEGRTPGKIKILIDRKERVLGTQIVGARAGDLILPSLYGVTKRLKLMDVMSPVYPYPTLGEIHRQAAGTYYGPRLFNPRIRKILKFLYRYRG